MRFPDAAIEMLREARWSPDATRSYEVDSLLETKYTNNSYEVMSGGFYWSDERLDEVAQVCRRSTCRRSQTNNTVCVKADSWAFRYVMGYRASLTRGEPREHLREPWEQLLLECPDWPGFRPERCDPSLVPYLEEESRKLCEALDEFDVPARRDSQRQHEFDEKPEL